VSVSLSAAKELPPVQHVAKMIDHSLLRPELTTDEVRSGIDLALRYDVATVTVRPCDASLAVDRVKGSRVGVSAVVGFPHGDQMTETKAQESQRLVELGCDELDMVINISWLRSGRDADVVSDIEHVVRAGVPVKVILETGYLNDEEKVLGCRLSEQAGATFVKTATGFGPGGATMEDLRLMWASVGPTVQVKAAGGVRDLDKLLAMAAIGVTRFGCTATAAILDDLRLRKERGE